MPQPTNIGAVRIATTVVQVHTGRIVHVADRLSDATDRQFACSSIGRPADRLGDQNNILPPMRRPESAQTHCAPKQEGRLGLRLFVPTQMVDRITNQDVCGKLYAKRGVHHEIVESEGAGCDGR